MITRKNQLHFRVSDEELQQIEEKMSSLGILKREPYLRKMALDGYCVRLDLQELRELTKLMRAVSNNLNQYTRWANESGNIDPEDVAALRKSFAEIYESEKRILSSLQLLS